MYIGSTEKRGVHLIIEEVVDVMLGCFRTGRTTSISVVLHTDGSITCCDDNTQCVLEVDEDMSYGNDRETTNLEASVSCLRIGGNRDSIFGSDRLSKGSLSGVMIVVTNFLSSQFYVEACGESEVYRQRYVQGTSQGAVEVKKRTTESGTHISFSPDPEIFPDEARDIDEERLRNRLEVLAYLNPGVTIQLEDERTDQRHAFQYSLGIRDYLDNRGHLETPFYESKPILLEAKLRDIDFEVAMRPCPSFVSYVNETECIEGGTHLTSFFQVLRDVLNEIGHRRELIEDEDKIPTVADYESQMHGVIALRMQHACWDGPHKTRINNAELADFVEAELKPKMVEFFESDEHVASDLIYRAVSKANARR